MEELKRYIEQQLLYKEFEAEKELFGKGTGHTEGYLCEQDVMKAIESIKVESFRMGAKYAMQQLSKP